MALTAVNHATAQEILTLGIGGDLHSLDPQTGTTSFIGFTGLHDHSWVGLAQDSQGRLYSSYGTDFTGFSLYEIDPNSGLATFFAQTSFTGVGAMAFGPGDELFIVNNPIWPTVGGIYELYTFDLTTGIETFIGSTGVKVLIAMDFKGGELYGHSYPEGIIQIDTATGVATDVNPNFRGPNGNTISLCFDDAGAFYFVDHALWMVSEQSGIRHPIDWLSYLGWWGEAVFVEGDQPNFSLTLEGTSGHYMGARIAGGTPNGEIALLWARGEGGPTPVPNGLPCAGTLMDLNSNMKLLATATADATGQVIIGPGPNRVPVAAAGLIWLQAIDLSTCETTNRIVVYI
jgi:hypothetical protein